MLHGHFLHQFENQDTLLRVEGVSGQAYGLCYCFDISVIQILEKPGKLAQ